jgi:hypothetical protein
VPERLDRVPLDAEPKNANELALSHRARGVVPARRRARHRAGTSGPSATGGGRQQRANTNWASASPRSTARCS